LTKKGLKIGGKGKDKLYDDMLPKHLNEIGKRYGVQLEKRTIPFGEGDRERVRGLLHAHHGGDA
jgi:hypothetical protein